MSLYRIATHIISPLMPIWLYVRMLRGKEDANRIKERFGTPSIKRPKGTVLWLHAASVGEANSVLELIETALEKAPHLNILLTTGTVTSAKLMHSRLPDRAIHQYAPIDTPKATERFIRHWHPDLAFWVESELWPNLIHAANDMQCFMGMINARMSKKSYHGWKKREAFARSMLSCFNLIFAQSDDDKVRYENLGARDVLSLGNLKFDAKTLPCDEEKLLDLNQQINDRPVWLAASTHPGEEEQIAQAHGLLISKRPNLLTIIVPRHPSRGDDIASLLRKTGKTTQRSKSTPLEANTQFYLADTLGELGIFYRISDIVFMGGSLVAHGGQNPLEPARLSCALMTGTHTHNFAGITSDMQKEKLLIPVQSAGELAAALDRLLEDTALRARMQQEAKQWVEQKSGARTRIFTYLEPLLQPYKAGQ